MSKNRLTSLSMENRISPFACVPFDGNALSPFKSSYHANDHQNRKKEKTEEKPLHGVNRIEWSATEGKWVVRRYYSVPLLSETRFKCFPCGIIEYERKRGITTID